MKILGIIPVRMESTRMPQKPIADIHGKPMLQHVWEAAQKSQKVDHWIIATPDESLVNLCKEWAAPCIITSNLHKSGTDRSAEAVLKLDDHYDGVINLQGDEPMIDPKQIDELADAIDQDTQIATLMKKTFEMQDIENINNVKVTFQKDHNALYFSRYPIPYFREDDQNRYAFLHVGMYYYRSDILQDIAQIPQGQFEKIEELEQLRWLENGYNIRCIETEYENYGVDTPEDLELVKNKMKNG